MKKRQQLRKWQKRWNNFDAIVFIIQKLFFLFLFLKQQTLETMGKEWAHGNTLLHLAVRIGFIDCGSCITLATSPTKTQKGGEMIVGHFYTGYHLPWVQLFQEATPPPRPASPQHFGAIVHLLEFPLAFMQSFSNPIFSEVLGNIAVKPQWLLENLDFPAQMATISTYLAPMASISSPCLGTF